ncbi:scavenger receptor protein SR2, putative [Eimeria acervulina]|uniref:Scavenger receptor protein SR2, putative n=1 Tax=Eimeria acervulina TaxID=5801 RepID=U6GP58_EIMAC|nr:scavenger receptor protein SR2, putative [Eimeria acervulina]CDI80404.1 scavenger receptor protein SR2, putative [Eimeria acervulina]
MHEIKKIAEISACFSVFLLALFSLTNAEYKEWCEAAPEEGKPDVAVCVPVNKETVTYMLEILPAYGAGVDLRKDVSVQLVGSNGRITPPIGIASAASGTHKRVFVEAKDVGDPEEIRAQSSAGTIGSIELTISGENRSGESKAVLQGVKPGEEAAVSFRGADVGSIESILLHNSAEDDPWFCESVRISAESESPLSFSVKRWIGSPFLSAVTITLRPSKDTDAAPQDIQCNTRGSDLVSLAPKQLETFKVRCPMNCGAASFAVTEGASIHPSSSSVCAAAEHDGVASASGGVLVVSVVGPLPQYAGLPPLKPGADSIDDIVGDVRVVDAHGKLAASGRLEIRREGVWGYLHGMYHEDGCLSLDGHNVCAGQHYPVAAAGECFLLFLSYFCCWFYSLLLLRFDIVYQNRNHDIFQCLGPEKTLTDCTFEEATAQCADHRFDVAVRCSNNPPAEPIFGSLRIVNEMGTPALDGIGRLQVYRDGWGSICDDGWTKESERVACMQMGYEGLREGGISGKSCENINGLNFCGLQEEPIHMVNVACQGDERSLRQCAHETKSDIYCAHSEDIVVSCKGNGGLSGAEGLKKEDLPDVIKRKYRSFIELSCTDKLATTKGVAAARPGAVFLGICPSGCR